MSSEFKDLLLKLPGNGKRFEELIDLACEIVFGKRVWLARGGPQHGGDMGNNMLDWPAIKVEAKQYSSGSKLNKRELLGEIAEAIQENRELDLWILATCAEVPEQVEKALSRESAKRGIGVEIIDLSSSPHCKLPRLLACALEDVVQFVHETLGEAEAKQMRQLLEKVSNHAELRHELINTMSLFDLVASQARSDLLDLGAGQK